MSKRRTPKEKEDILMELFNTNVSAAELCRIHNISPATMQAWKDKFLQGGRYGIRDKSARISKAHEKKIEHLQRIIGELTVANDILKKNWREDGVEKRGSS